jgi:putative MATE family efflux protein
MPEPVSNPDNIYLSGSLLGLYARTATPIIAVMGVNGLFTIVDAYFLGVFVGADALTAVTLMFPLYIMIVALSTLVSSGFSSIFARLLGANSANQASLVFNEAIQLSLVVCSVLMGLFLFFGESLISAVANSSTILAELGYIYISIFIFCSPLLFVLAINIDALRCEGMLHVMGAITLMSALLNILFNYILIVEFQWGVAGSAYGTVLAQICSMLAVNVYRRMNVKSRSVKRTKVSWIYWAELLRLGAPSSLGYIGIALSAALTLYCLQLWAGSNYEALAGAFGIISRLMTFAILPLFGLSMAFQTIVGNNYGAKQWGRSNNTLKLAVLMAFVYCVIVQVAFIANRSEIGFVFVDDIAIVGETSRIIPYVFMRMFVFGPLIMISTYFQAIGDAGRATLLALSRTYLFVLPLTFLMPFWFGEPGIWYAGLVAEVLVLTLTMFVLRNRRYSQGKPWGLFEIA